MTRILLFTVLWMYGSTDWVFAQTTQRACTVSGFVRNRENELLPHATVQAIEGDRITQANSYGFYSITVPSADSIHLQTSYVGYATASVRLACRQNAIADVQLDDTSHQLNEVVVSALSRQANNSLTISPKQLADIPFMLGEKDIVKGFQLMPGVQKGIDGSGALYVRGGNGDQNLIILDEAVVYNAYHAFGIFSVFNADAIKNAELIKGGFSAQYGGRLSSVMAIQMNEGRRDSFHGKASVGLLSAKATVEGPLAAGKGSYMLSGRRTYFDALTAPFFDDNFRVNYFFHDVNAKANYDLGRANKLFISAYIGQDNVGVREKTTSMPPNRFFNDFQFRMGWQSQTVTTRWNHVFSGKVFMNTSAIFSAYTFNLSQSQNSQALSSENRSFTTNLQYASKVRDISLKTDIDYFVNASHALRFGVLLTRHSITPNSIQASDSRAGTLTQNVVQNQPAVSIEGAAYAEDTYRIGNWFKAVYGLRLSGFQTGARSYVKAEPRLNTAYTLTTQTDLYATYARMNQYINLLSNSGVGFPTDMWVPATDRIAPQQADLLTVGFSTRRGVSSWVFSAEGYYKTMRNLLSIREGESFLSLNKTDNGLRIAYDENDWQDKITQGTGYSYGTELLARKNHGRLTGWVGYTLSWTMYQFPDINGGVAFRPRQDRRHDLSVVGVYKLNRVVQVSANWVFGSGQPITVPESRYVATAHVPLFSLNRDASTALTYPARGSVLLPAYHRLDLGVQFIKQKSRNRSRTWEISAVNVYNRQNPAFFYVDTTGGSNTNAGQLNRVVLVPFIPSVSYSFTF
ncbi:TonB-dependent receptor [Spirosoma montaniterrae]|uniref:TonB-dependent receptor plug domain-containing protein n=1 Tax=Spirosoma montaniterrae TaxID=1178516 RepID=A0A1P9WU83_9BACT|nr:carboxypeptidase-like regulatory domain-containing protein [Spirosoma montaniterrae]AQG78944.1 hypothetical protein AWR27_06150 [Spirosoma montaniterrae]